MLAAAVAEAGVPVLVNASAVGYYGDTGDRVVDETARAGDRFPGPAVSGLGGGDPSAAQAGVRVVLARTGLVLAPRAGCSAG